MKKMFLMMCVILVRDLVARDFQRPSARQVLDERFYSREALEEQLYFVRTQEDLQVLAAWLQLELLRAPQEMFEKLASSELWRTSTKHVRTLVRRLSVETTGGQASLYVYQQCFLSLATSCRYVPGVDEKKAQLLRPEILRRRAGIE